MFIDSMKENSLPICEGQLAEIKLTYLVACGITI